MSESLLDYEKRPIRYSSIDGIDELLIGVFILVSTILMYVVNTAPQGSIWRWKPTVLISNALLLVVFLLARKLLKERITYRRTGYVRYRYSKVKSAIGGIVGFVVAAALVVSIYVLWHPPARDRSLILLGSLLWATLYVYFYVHLTKMYRAWRYLVAVVMAAGPVALYSVLPNVRDISTLSAGLLGACFSISGVVAFLSYLRKTKPDNVQSQEGQ